MSDVKLTNLIVFGQIVFIISFIVILCILIFYEISLGKEVNLIFTSIQVWISIMIGYFFSRDRVKDLVNLIDMKTSKINQSKKESIRNSKNFEELNQYSNNLNLYIKTLEKEIDRYKSNK
jgi:hypothetical protein